jgi:hypothetical protein
VVSSSSGSDVSGVWVITVTFSSPMTSTNYSATVTPEGTISAADVPYISGKTTTGFTIDIPGLTDPGTSFDWQATASS